MRLLSSFPDWPRFRQMIVARHSNTRCARRQPTPLDVSRASSYPRSVTADSAIADDRHGHTSNKLSNPTYW